jgi:hypothetical protein
LGGSLGNVGEIFLRQIDIFDGLRSQDGPR